MELLDVYDNYGNITGRTIIRGDKTALLNENEHIAVSVIFIENENGEFLIQKTSQEKFDFIHDDQVNWYKEQILRLNKEEGKTVSSLGFFHIPLQQYKTAYDLYESGSSEVKYFFGSNDEKMINKICASEYPSSLFDTAKSLGSTKGFFCGHDHYNNMSLEYEGIRLTYGMSIWNEY